MNRTADLNVKLLLKMSHLKENWKCWRVLFFCLKNLQYQV